MRNLSACLVFTPEPGQSLKMTAQRNAHNKLYPTTEYANNAVIGQNHEYEE